MKRLAVTMFIGLIALGVRARADEGLVGTWIVQPQPGQLDSTIVFSRNGSHIVGLWTKALGFLDISLQDIREEGEGLSLRLEVPGIPPTDVPYYMRGARRGDDLRFWIEFGGQDIHIVVRARRASARDVAAQQAAIPRNIITQKITLPPLHDVRDNGLARTPPMGWNSWNHFGDAIDERTIREVADAVVSSGLRDAGYVYLNIDSGWQGFRDAQGVLHSNEKFPDMKALVGYVHAKGLKFGIYTTPGPRGCDNRVGSHGFETQDAKMFADWGADYLKYDLCSAGVLYKTEPEKQAVFQKMGDALLATHRPIVYSLSGFGRTPGLGRKVGGNLWRTSYDISDRWISISERFEHNGDPAQARPGGWNDPDMMEIGNGGLSLTEYRTHMTLWSIQAAPLILGNDVRVMTEGVRDLLLNPEVIAVDQDSLGVQGTRVSHKGAVEAWMKPLADRSVAVALFNRGQVPAKAEIQWSELGRKGVQRVRDLWKRADIGMVADRYEATVPPHGTAMIRVTAPENN